MDAVIELTLLRHGRSRADDENVYEGRYDSPLTEVGKAQALARAEGWLKEGIQFDRVICSTLQRARTTAEIVAGVLGVPVETDPDWMEVDHGPLAGFSIEEAEKLYPRPAFRNPYQRIAGTGESDTGLHARAALAVERIVQRGPGRYLVVTHGGILNAAMRVIFNIPVPVNYLGGGFAFGDLGFARLTYAPSSHRWTLHQFGP